MSQSNKVRSVLRNFEQIIDELPIFLLRLEEINSAVDDRIQWREFKFCFKVATSKVVSKLLNFRSNFDVTRFMKIIFSVWNSFESKCSPRNFQGCRCKTVFSSAKRGVHARFIKFRLTPIFESSYFSGTSRRTRI